MGLVTSPRYAKKHVSLRKSNENTVRRWKYLESVKKKQLPFDKPSNNIFLFYFFKVLDSKCLFIGLDFEILTTEIRQKLLEIYQLKDKMSFSREADFGNFRLVI